MMSVRDIFGLIRWQDVLDVSLVTFVVYRVFVFLKGTRALKILAGVAVVFMFYFLTDFLGLHVLNWLLNSVISSIVIVLLVVFTPEIRRGLMLMGRGAVARNASRQNLNAECLDEVLRAVKALAMSQTGAIIVFQRDDELNEYLEDATLMNARVSKELLVSLFQPATPLHDGAVVIREGLVMAAGCFLPLTSRQNLSRDLGTRHRAAIGITEETDAICLVVSEETGGISVTVDGKITRRLEEGVLERLMLKLLTGERKKEKKK